MSKKGFLFAATVMLTAFFSEFVLAQAGAQQTPKQQAKPKQQQAKNESGSALADELLNDFEDAEDWRAFSTTPLGDTKIKKTVQIGPIQDTYNPNNLTDEERKAFVSGQNHVLGVKTFFNEKGFDRVIVKPPHEYIVKGIGRQVDVWALGRQFRHTLFVVLRDYRGRIHKLRLGRLDYLGWRKLSVTVPGWLPQSQRFALLDKNLHFVSLYVQSDQKEIGGDFYFYVDNLSMKVDKTDTDYPGSMIKDTW
ncbi:MAG: flagellar filament outer layer protein FlaA [Spirochaetia bacterium]|nr:flagellar filament outer layer protein FlaA [Spirochaetia bacterium]